MAVGVVGFVFALLQIRKTKRAAEAAADAATKTLIESKRSYERFVATYASRLLSELQRAANDGEWKLAEVRAHESIGSR